MLNGPEIIYNMSSLGNNYWMRQLGYKRIKTSKYMPHQNKREKERRLKQLAKRSKHV